MMNVMTTPNPFNLISARASEAAPRAASKTAVNTTVKTMLALCLGAALSWQPAAAQKSLKVGFVNIARIMQDAPQAKAAKERLEKEFSERNDRLRESEGQIGKLEDKLRRNGDKMEAKRRKRLEREIISKGRKLRSRKEDFQSDFTERRNEELAGIQKMVAKVISDLAKEQKFDLIVSEPVIYASERIDVTARVLKVLEKRAR